MNVPAALVLQSIPFAGLVLARRGGPPDLFAILYIVGVGLLVSLIASAGNQVSFDQTISAISAFE